MILSKGTLASALIESMLGAYNTQCSSWGTHFQAYSVWCHRPPHPHPTNRPSTKATSTLHPPPSSAWVSNCSNCPGPRTPRHAVLPLFLTRTQPYPGDTSGGRQSVRQSKSHTNSRAGVSSTRQWSFQARLSLTDLEAWVSPPRGLGSAAKGPLSSRSPPPDPR